MTFVHLNLHSDYSVSDGTIRLKSLVKTCKQLGYESVALTDRMNLFGLIQFYEQAEKNGIKPLIGAELLVEIEGVGDARGRMPYAPLIVLCQNEVGYAHLRELISRAYLSRKTSREEAYVRREWLTTNPEGLKGLIAIAPFEDSEWALQVRAHLASVSSGQEAMDSSGRQHLEALLGHWMKLFQGGFYLEWTRIRPYHAALERLEAFWLHLASAKQCPVVATNAVRFLEADDFEAHEIRVCIHEGSSYHDEKRARRYTSEQHLKSPAAMEILFEDAPIALQNAVEIAKRCNVELKLGQIHLPCFPVPSGFDANTYLRHLAEKGLEQRFKQSQHAAKPFSLALYEERLRNEIQVIAEMGFAGYFLIVADFIAWAKSQDIPVGPGRGSGAGSLVAYSLGITDLDPLPYDLLFERFLNPERVSMPDFDIDFCMDRRDEVIDYVVHRYGKEAVSQIITFGSMAAKAVVRDVGRVLGHPYGFVDRIAKLIPHELGITLSHALASEEALKSRYESEEEVRQIMDMALRLEGLTRNLGTHAGGVVIAPSRLQDFTPLYVDPDQEMVVTQFNKNDVETIGLIKFDFLGLRTLTIIHWAVQHIQKRSEERIDINRIPLDDEKAFELLRMGETTAVFQVESRGMKELVKRLRPDCFEDLIALVALYRPGPLQSGMVDDFIARKHGKARIEDLHPCIAGVLKPTYGIILYQEQVMQIAQEMAGYTLGEADLLRRAMGKKKPAEMEKQRAIFLKGASEKGIDASRAILIFDLMEKFAGYGFNKSHSATYALLTYQTAWLKARYPAEFMAAVLSSEMNHTDKLGHFIEDCKRMGLKILPPHVNHSEAQFTVRSDGSVVYGLSAIKGVGDAAVLAILEAREKGGEFKDVLSFCARIDKRKVTRAVIEALIGAGALDDALNHRAYWWQHRQKVMQVSEQWERNQLRGQIDLFADVGCTVEDLQVELIPVQPWPFHQQLEMERQYLGLYLTGHPIQSYGEELKSAHVTPLQHLSAGEFLRLAGFLVAHRRVRTKKGEHMGFLLLEDQVGRQEVALFPDLHAHFLAQIGVGYKGLLIVEGASDADAWTGGIRVRTHRIETIQQFRRRARGLHLGVTREQGEETVKTLLSILDAHRSEGDTGFLVRVWFQQGERWVECVQSVGIRVTLPENGWESIEALLSPEFIKWDYPEVVKPVLAKNRRVGGTRLGQGF